MGAFAEEAGQHSARPTGQGGIDFVDIEMLWTEITAAPFEQLFVMLARCCPR